MCFPNSRVRSLPQTDFPYDQLQFTFPNRLLIEVFSFLCSVAPPETCKSPPLFLPGPTARQPSSPASTPSVFTVLVSPESRSPVGFHSPRSWMGERCSPPTATPGDVLCSPSASMWVGRARLLLCFAFIIKLLKTITAI